MKSFVNPPHIALVIHLLGGRSGGAERIYCELANLLDEMGYIVTCLYYDSKDVPPFYRINPTVERINLYPKKIDPIVEGEWLKKYPHVKKFGSDYKAWSKKSFFIHQLHEYFVYAKPEIAISLMPPANTPTLLASIGTEVKVIPTNHNVPKEDYESPSRWDQNPVDRLLRLQALDEAAAIHVLFPDFGTWFPEHLQEKIVPIPNYVSPEFCLDFTGNKKEKLILGVGRLAPVKNYGELVRAWGMIHSDFPDWSVEVYGTGPQLGELNALIEQVGVSKSFTLAGHRADLGEVYQRASIFCHPALFEGFGLSPAEALYMQTPVIIFEDCPGTNQFVRNQVNGLALSREQSTENLAAGLRLLIEDETLREQLGKNGPDSIKHFSLDAYKSNWKNIIESLRGGLDA